MSLEARTTTDTYTGKPFRFNDVVIVGGVRTPARYTKLDRERGEWPIHLDPSRVPKDLLRELNPELLELLGLTGSEPWCNHDAAAVAGGVCECGVRGL